MGGAASDPMAIEALVPCGMNESPELSTDITVSNNSELEFKKKPKKAITTIVTITVTVVSKYYNYEDKVNTTRMNLLHVLQKKRLRTMEGREGAKHFVNKVSIIVAMVVELRIQRSQVHQH